MRLQRRPISGAGEKRGRPALTVGPAARLPCFRFGTCLLAVERANPQRAVAVAQRVLSGRPGGIPVMPQNFIDCDREQAFLMPPSLRDWLPEDHLAWFVIEAVGRLDLQPFYAAYRADGHGRAAYDPSMVVSLVCTRIRPMSGPRAGSSGGVVRTSRTG